ncbi:MAG: hypothetical protein KJ954_14150, partial [Alphaproteobacteria bacterium]|nr:hypothetical protein [Alphaproteobacteria bacterium]
MTRLFQWLWKHAQSVEAEYFFCEKKVGPLHLVSSSDGGEYSRHMWLWGHQLWEDFSSNDYQG